MRAGTITFWTVIGGLALVFVCAGIYPYVFSRDWPELSREGVTGTWTSTTGAVLQLDDDGAAHVDNLPGDVWGGETQSDLVEIRGSWRLCGNPPGSDCQQYPEDYIFLSLQITYDVVLLNGNEVESDGVLTNIEVTEDDAHLVLWFRPHPDSHGDPRTRFVKT